MALAMGLLRCFLAVSCALALAPAWADTGAVSQLSGTLSVKKPDGTVRLLARNSEVRSGDVLSTERDSYAQIRFSDGGQITLKPGTAVKLDDFKYSADKPQEDAFLFSLLKGGLRAVTGLVGKRNRDRYLMNTATATVGIRGTTFSADDCTGQRDGDCARLQEAVYVGVSDGEIVVRNEQGELALGAGQFGHIARGEKPLFLSTDPGLQFAPPATFIQSLLSGRQVAGIGEKLECAISAR
jgi:FecR-like protein